jgi:V/A-type H+-transporting ATPase subunit D
MARLSLSKSSLSHEQRQLKTFERFLPSLDMKRKQLMAQRAAARDALMRTRGAMAELRAEVVKGLPMLSNREVDLDGLVTLEDAVETLLGLEIVDEMDKHENMQALARRRWAERVRSMGLVVDSELDPDREQ